MGNVRGLPYVHEGNEIQLSEADELRLKNKQLYRLILQLVSEIDALEDALAAAETADAGTAEAAIRRKKAR
jgi:hypothetical protein